MTASPLVLLVEDNMTNQLLTSSVLEREGYRVEIAGSAVEAMELLRASRPDLILMDIQLPGLDGLALTRMLRGSVDSAAIPIVALTAHAMSGDREEAMAAGCLGYISKPIDTRTFGEQVRGFLFQAVSKQ